MMTLTAPENIRGPLPRYTPPELRAERLAWLESLPDTVTNAEISAALGINETSVSRLRRMVTPRRERQRSRRFVNERGLHCGHVLPAVLAMPAEAQDALEAMAARRGQTLAEALAAAWVEAQVSA